MKKRYGCLLLILVLLTGLTGALAGPDLTLRDASSRSGLWAEAYSRILTERAEGVRAYQTHVLDDTYSTVCRPVGLVDLTRDGDAVSGTVAIPPGLHAAFVWRGRRRALRAGENAVEECWIPAKGGQ